MAEFGLDNNFSETVRFFLEKKSVNNTQSGEETIIACLSNIEEYRNKTEEQVIFEALLERKKSSQEKNNKLFSLKKNYEINVEAKVEIPNLPVATNQTSENPTFDNFMKRLKKKKGEAPKNEQIVISENILNAELNLTNKDNTSSKERGTHFKSNQTTEIAQNYNETQGITKEIYSKSYWDEGNYPSSKVSKEENGGEESRLSALEENNFSFKKEDHMGIGEQLNDRFSVSRSNKTAENKLIKNYAQEGKREQLEEENERRKIIEIKRREEAELESRKKEKEEQGEQERLWHEEERRRNEEIERLRREEENRRNFAEERKTLEQEKRKILEEEERSRQRIFEMEQEQRKLLEDKEEKRRRNEANSKAKIENEKLEIKDNQRALTYQTKEVISSFASLETRESPLTSNKVPHQKTGIQHVGSDSSTLGTRTIPDRLKKIEQLLYQILENQVSLENRLSKLETQQNEVIDIQREQAIVLEDLKRNLISE